MLNVSGVAATMPDEGTETMSSAPSNEVAADTLVQSKPAFLRRVRIRGYKSIAFCDVTLEPLTILVGRNASGKSNFLDALAFLRDLMEMSAAAAVNTRKGWGSLHCRTGSPSFIEMGIEATFASLQSKWNADYSFSLQVAPQNQIRVRHESLNLTQSLPGHDRHCGYHVSEGRLEWIGEEHFEEDSEWTSKEDVAHDFGSNKLEDPRFFKQWRPDRLVLSVIGTQPFVDFAEGLRASGVYNFHPPAIRSHQPSATAPILKCDGANLARAIEGLREIEPDTVTRIKQYMKAIVPEIAEFYRQEYGDFETVRFNLNARGGQSPLKLDASSMSDGTLRVLAALVAAFQIVLPSGFPGFIGIEEPETSLHPAALRALVDALDEATLRTQILLTTHSADILDNPAILPENVRVVQMVDGQTVIAPVDEASVEIVRQKLDTLGGLERQNQLEPDPDDQERQHRLSKNGRGSEE
jgi:predicted ATPase